LDIDVDEESVEPDASIEADFSTEESLASTTNTEPSTIKNESKTVSQSSEAELSSSISSRSKNAGIFTPAVRHMVKEHGINVEDIEGTGKGGRVLKEDVFQYISSQSLKSATVSSPISLANSSPTKGSPEATIQPTSDEHLQYPSHRWSLKYSRP
jgi:2-oxoisovalerate dehydrogenase E2 component (dihydrolipoyl transacylase)